MSLLELGNTSRCRDNLLMVESNDMSPKSIKALSLRGIAKSYEADKNYARAENFYNNLLVKYPNDCDQAEIMSSLIDCAKARGNIKLASHYQNELKRMDSKSPYLTKKKPTKGNVPKLSGLHRVQVGVFSNRKRALALLEKLYRKKIKSVVIHKDGKYILQAGSFSSIQRANAQATKIKRLGFDAIVK